MVYTDCEVTASATPAFEVPDLHAAPFLVTEQAVTFEDVHEIVEEFPAWSLIGVALMVAVGCATVTVAFAEVEPPGPVQVIW